MTVSLRRLTRDVRARSKLYDELPNAKELEPGMNTEIDRVRQRLLALGVDVTDRTQARAVLALMDVFAQTVSTIAAGWCKVILAIVALTPTELALELPGEDDE